MDEELKRVTFSFTLDTGDYIKAMRLFKVRAAEDGL
jgi:cupin superfamily acireductone dioxygenase involved in methionine salvage